MATTTAYLVEAGEYEDRRVLVISLDQAAAQRYADRHNCQRNRSVFAEVSEVECIPADWAPPVVEVEPEYCDNCHATTADACFCAEQIHYLMRLVANAHQRCTGCLGAGTGARCCICGGLR